ncbi:MAG: DUF2608 domain-containing protein [bacterium]
MKHFVYSFKYVRNFVFVLFVTFLSINIVQASKQQFTPVTPEKVVAERHFYADFVPSSLFSGSSIDPCLSIRVFEAYIPFLTKKDLVLFDLDNAFFEPEREDGVGSDQWFNGGLDYVRKNIPGKDPLKIMLSIAFECRTNLRMRPVEHSVTLEVLKKIQATGCRVMALTSRSIVKQTFAQLKDIKGADFAKNAPSHEPFEKKLEKDWIAYKDGILFCGSNDKATALYTLWDEKNFDFEFVMFLDDGLKHLQNVQQATNKRNIPFRGFHYVRLEKKVKNYKFDLKTIAPYLKRALTNPIESHPNLACLE